MFGLDPDWTHRVQVAFAIVITALVVFIIMQFWAFYDLEEGLVEWVVSWSWKAKLGTTSCLSIGIPIGVYFSFRSLRRSIRNTTSFASDRTFFDR